MAKHELRSPVAYRCDVSLFSLAIFCLLLFLASFHALAQTTQSEPVFVAASVSEIDDRLLTIKNSTSLSDEEKRSIVSDLEAAQQAMLERDELQRLTASYAASHTNARTTLDELDARLANYVPPRLPDSAQLSSRELELELADRRLSLRDLTDRAADIEAELREEIGVDIPALLAEVRERIDSLARPGLAGQSAQLQAAADEVRSAMLAMLYARAEMLDERLLSRRSRLDIMRRELQFSHREISAMEDQVAVFRASEFANSIAQADQAVARTKTLAGSVEANGQALSLYAADNIKLAQEWRSLISKREALADRDSAMGGQVQRLTDRVTTLSQQLQRSTLPREWRFGAALLEQNALLKTGQLKQQISRELENDITESRLREIELFEHAQAKWLAEDYGDIANPSSDPALEHAARELSDQRQTLVDQLTVEYAKHDEQFSFIEDERRRLTELTESYRVAVDQHLLWHPSAAIVGMATVQGVVESMSNLIGVGTSLSVPSIARMYDQRPLLSFTMALLAIGLFAFKRRHTQELKAMTKLVGRVQSDSALLTVRAAWLTLLFALPITILLATPGLLSLTLANNDPQLWPAFLRVALLYFGFEFFRQTLRDYGLSELHFGQPSKQVSLVKRQLRLFMPLFLPPAILYILLDHLATPSAGASLGRVCFIVSALTFSGFSMAITRPLTGESEPNVGLRRPLYRYAIVLFGAIVPVALASLSFLGYQYAAGMLAGKLLLGIAGAAGVYWIYHFSVRAISVAERQLALKRIQAKRAANRKDAVVEGAAADTEAGSVALQTDEIDLQTISEHARALIKLLLSIATAVSIWTIVSDLPVAFEPLQSFTLWQTTSTINGVETTLAFTVWHLLAAGLVLVITYLGVRNIPGTLEVLVLSRLSLPTGMSYAITTVVTYVIVFAGVMVFLQLIGAQWSKLQWLIAALGVGLGFGLQEIVANFISGVLILFERPIRLGDTITIGDQSGIVTQIRIRATTIVNWDRKEILIPNKAFITDRLTNWTLTDSIMRVIVTVGVAYGSDVVLVEQLLLELAKENTRVRDEPAPTVFFHKFGDSSLEFETRVFVDGIQHLVPVQHELNKAIDANFKENDIEIAFPQRDIHLDSGPLAISIVDAAADAGRDSVVPRTS